MKTATTHTVADKTSGRQCSSRQATHLDLINSDITIDIKCFSDKQALDKLIKNMQAKTSGKVPEDVNFEILEVKTNAGQAFSDAIEMHNKFIARAFLLPELLGFTEHKTGSQALGREQFDLYYNSVVLSIQKELEDLINENHIESLKKSPLIINTARAGIVSDKFLIKALQKKIISGLTRGAVKG